MALSHPETHRITEKIIGAAFEVHHIVGPGLLESTYEECLYWELVDRDLKVRRQCAVPIRFKWRKIAAAYRLDLIVEEKVVIEVKSIEKVLPVHKAQVLTYLRMTDIKVGLLFNFNTTPFTTGIHRISL
jgi:GxxExxY protein